MVRPLLLASALAAALPAQAPLCLLATEDLGPLTPPPALAAVGLSGTDLGVSFPLGDQLVFLFGDSWTLDRADWDVDSVAWTPLTPLRSGRPPRLVWRQRPGHRFLPLQPQGVKSGGMDVPVEGVTVGERTFVFFSSGWDPRRKRHSHSLLAHTAGDDFEGLQMDHRVATDRFVNVSVVADGATLWIFGTGAYRQSSVYLARVAAADLADRAAWRYWPGFQGDEARAEPLVKSNCLGELSVRRLPDGLWAMTKNAAVPRGIHLRTAKAPTGPWSAPVVIFDPARDGYGRIMHQQVRAVGFDDGLSEPGREEEWGGEYGPYLVPQWCGSPRPGVHELVYTLSTWNPYAVRLLRSYVGIAGATWKPPLAKAAAARPPRNLDFAGGALDGWQQEGGPFATSRRDDGSWLLCTYVPPRGDAVTGRLWQEFDVPAQAKELRGFVHGGSEAVQLWRGDELLRSTRGRRSNEVEVELRWRLDDDRGQSVRLVVVDQSTAKWGFVSVRGLRLVE